MWDYFALAQPISPAVIPSDPTNLYQQTVPAAFQDRQSPVLPPIYHPTDDSFRSLMLPYQRNYQMGRLAAPIADHLIPTSTGGYTAIAGGGVGRPSRLASVPVYTVAPNGSLVRAGRVATSSPAQWVTPAAFDNGTLYGKAEPIRWPDA